MLREESEGYNTYEILNLGKGIPDTQCILRSRPGKKQLSLDIGSSPGRLELIVITVEDNLTSTVIEAPEYDPFPSLYKKFIRQNYKPLSTFCNDPSISYALRFAAGLENEDLNEPPASNIN